MLTADDLASWLEADHQRDDMMGKVVKEAEGCGLRLRRARTECEHTEVQEVWNARKTQRLPVLVTREERRAAGENADVHVHLVGIVTSFDLL